MTPLALADVKFSPQMAHAPQVKTRGPFRRLRWYSRRYSRPHGLQYPSYWDFGRILHLAHFRTHLFYRFIYKSVYTLARSHSRSFTGKIAQLESDNEHRVRNNETTPPSPIAHEEDGTVQRPGGEGIWVLPDCLLLATMLRTPMNTRVQGQYIPS
jgi:hypothetical protein